MPKGKGPRDRSTGVRDSGRRRASDRGYADGAGVNREEREDLRIVAAAVLHAGKLYTGKRHGKIMSEIYKECGFCKIPQEEQGFTTSTGTFVNRFQAGAIAYRSGQTTVRHQTLLSEHVWPDP
jgi:hypothetical protein